MVSAYLTTTRWKRGCECCAEGLGDAVMSVALGYEVEVGLRPRTRSCEIYTHPRAAVWRDGDPATKP